ncbi:MAG: lipoyl synthase [Syntrophobacterales bacterium]|nr:lipoyl synthase [Syntrophobacterales bacterium]
MQVGRRKPDWLKVRLPNTPEFNRVAGTLADCRLHSVCQEARCPNIAECFHSGTATFLILGNVCTRHCLYCNVRHGVPSAPDAGEPARLTEAATRLNLRYVVITSVTRDDLPDGGAGLFAACIEALRARVPGCRVEVLIPDFRGNPQALERVANARPDVINHNMEVARPLFPALRPQGDYGISLEIISRIKRYDAKIISKSGFMVGLGEGWGDIIDLMEDLAGAGCERLTIGQYQQPRRDNAPVQRYYHPEEFERLREIALGRGFQHVEAGPLVRSSYHAAGAD